MKLNLKPGNKAMQWIYPGLIGMLMLRFLEPVAAASGWVPAAHDATPTQIPQQIVLSWTGDPATTQTVTWRTDITVQEAYGEIAMADASPNFIYYTKQIPAQTEKFHWEELDAHYHSVTFKGLEPNTIYAYRVGGADQVSEWFHFRTATPEFAPFTFLYFGDAQNNILSLWSRVLRRGFQSAPQARLMVHAGDLVNHANRDQEWSEWFAAGDWLHAMVPSLMVPGNHEYWPGMNLQKGLSDFWQPQFTLPDNGIPALPESNYFVDFQGVRFIALDSNTDIKDQADWLAGVLDDNPSLWTVAFFHHPVYSATRNRNNQLLRNQWKPLFDKYRVDLVLAGHDHTYARGHNVDDGLNIFDPQTGTVYVVSVSGPKMYNLTEDRWMDRAAENTQLYQVISVTRDTLFYEARTATDELYDAFRLVKQGDQPNLLLDDQPADVPERMYQNTLQVPESQ